MKIYFLSTYLFCALLWAGSESVNTDEKGLASLEDSGSNLKKSHLIDFFLEFPTTETARAVCATLESRGYTSHLHPAGDYGDKPVCRAVQEMVPNLDELKKIHAEFSTIAKENGGHYDGWGAPVVE